MLKVIVNSDNIKFINRWSLKYPVKTFCDIEAIEVYTPCDGTVMYTGRDNEGYYNVLLQICADVVVNLKHLRDCYVNTGQLLKAKTEIGIARRFVRIEVGTLTRDKCDETIRIYNKQYYKRDPEQLTEENLGFIQFNHGETEYVYPDNKTPDITRLTKEQENEYKQLEDQKVDE